MARKVFLSFHYDDIWRVNQIRNSSVVRGTGEIAGFVDKAEFEEVQRKGQTSIERWIDQQLDGTSTTVVLIGLGTSDRPYVKYEIERSYERGNRLLGIWLDNMKDKDGQISWLRGSNPFEHVHVGGYLFGSSVSRLLDVPVYDWVKDGGREKIARWIEKAPRRAEQSARQG